MSDYEQAALVWKNETAESAVRWADNGGGDPVFALWAWLWAEDGFWGFQTSHKYAAALMCTATHGAEDLLIPARAMRFQIPDGILRHTGAHFRWAYLLASPTMGTLALCEKEAFGSDQQFVQVGIAAKSARDVLFVDPDLTRMPYEQIVGDEGHRDVNRRCLLMARRLVVGSLYTMQHTHNWSRRLKPHTGYDRRTEGAPDHRNIVVGCPLTYDARKQVAEWLAGGASRRAAAPAFQHIVRGHYKRQVIGEGRANRKVIWVEPYWRGPAGAPILIRERRIEA